MGSLNLAGKLTLVSSTRKTEEGLHLVIGDAEVKFSELTVQDDTPVTLPLNLSPSVTEALMLVLYCARVLDVTLTASGSSDTITLKMKGYSILTLAPEGGLTQVQVASPEADPAENLNVFYAVVAAEPDKPLPPFWATT